MAPPSKRQKLSEKQKPRLPPQESSTGHANQAGESVSKPTSGDELISNRARSRSKPSAGGGEVATTSQSVKGGNLPRYKPGRMDHSTSRPLPLSLAGATRTSHGERPDFEPLRSRQRRLNAGGVAAPASRQRQFDNPNYQIANEHGRSSQVGYPRPYCGPHSAPATQSEFITNLPPPSSFSEPPSAALFNPMPSNEGNFPQGSHPASYGASPSNILPWPYDGRDQYGSSAYGQRPAPNRSTSLGAEHGHHGLTSFDSYLSSLATSNASLSSSYHTSTYAQHLPMATAPGSVPHQNGATSPVVSVQSHASTSSTAANGKVGFQSSDLTAPDTRPVSPYEDPRHPIGHIASKDDRKADASATNDTNTRPPSPYSDPRWPKDDPRQASQQALLAAPTHTSNSIAVEEGASSINSNASSTGVFQSSAAILSNTATATGNLPTSVRASPYTRCPSPYSDPRYPVDDFEQPSQQEVFPPLESHSAFVLRSQPEYEVLEPQVAVSYRDLGNGRPTAMQPQTRSSPAPLLQNQRPRPATRPRVLAPSPLPNYDELGVHGGSEEADAAHRLLNLQQHDGESQSRVQRQSNNLQAALFQQGTNHQHQLQGPHTYQSDENTALRQSTSLQAAQFQQSHGSQHHPHDQHTYHRTDPPTQQPSADVQTTDHQGYGSQFHPAGQPFARPPTGAFDFRYQHGFQSNGRSMPSSRFSSQDLSSRGD